MSRPEDTLEQLARLARDDEALHAASERRPPALPRSEEVPPASGLPDSLAEPLSEAQRASFVDAIQARLANAERVAVPTPLPSLARRRRLVTVVALTAAAAGVLFALRTGPDADGALSRYEVRLEGSQQTERGAAQVPDLLRLRPSTTLRFELRPTHDERGSVRVRAFVHGALAAAAGETRELTVSQEQSTAGALRVAAPLPAALSERGELVLYVGRPSAVEHAQPNDKLGTLPSLGTVQEFRWPFERVP
ncbi:MAG TPA: hypothetical protein VFK05_10910 [Polyangiaceae bacterium]|nr:hypothetical protein [Polyangiaceae bacterium]